MRGKGISSCLSIRMYSVRSAYPYHGFKLRPSISLVGICLSCSLSASLRACQDAYVYSRRAGYRGQRLALPFRKQKWRTKKKRLFLRDNQQLPRIPDFRNGGQGTLATLPMTFAASVFDPLELAVILLLGLQRHNAKH